MSYDQIRVGDRVLRNMGGLPMTLTVTAVDDLIHCGQWTFSKVNGAEVDPDLGWNELRSGSFITPILQDEQVTPGRVGGQEAPPARSKHPPSADPDHRRRFA